MLGAAAIGCAMVVIGRRGELIELIEKNNAVFNTGVLTVGFDKLLNDITNITTLIAIFRDRSGINEKERQIYDFRGFAKNGSFPAAGGTVEQ